MADKSSGSDKAPIIVIKKIKKGGGGHHGGAWKVAYADFVTAMMAFFLLMWLLNSTSKEQKEGIAEYFDPTPTIVSQSQSGAGGVMGGLTISPEGARMADTQPMTPSNVAPSQPKKSAKDMSDAELEAEKKKREAQQFDNAKKEIEKAIQNSDLKDLQKNLKVDMTPEGLRIQIIDQEGASMFPIGSATPFAKTEKLLAKVAEIIATLPNQISVRGHTDGAPYSEGANYTNWELSSDRANSSRRVLLASGIPAAKVANVIGKADTDHYVKTDALDAQNRRISIVLLHGELTKEKGTANSMDKTAPATAPPTYRPTQGKVQFP
ncbi:MAG: motility protein MotB [Micavibrio aeruginosavorus]|uniref:Motility protein MotB n=1 Tax=Micavibrio aeruginosavorus TaxID=349221 RepID=A0A2W5H9E2_9BACT|nr:MAG: motility protein MotB [Micavibrio aeruginosavorus]